MTITTSIPRHLLAFSILTLILMPISIYSTPTQLDSFAVAADDPLSVILMIGDGMGYQHVELARLVEVGDSGSLIMQDSDWNASIITSSANSAVTDSAAAATAMATGLKTNNGFISIDSSHVILETILEYAQTLNKATGII
ncbi:MAG: alkaline phosphatase, partial [Candidatus Thorarchaeota archaeon]